MGDLNEMSRGLADKLIMCLKVIGYEEYKNCRHEGLRAKNLLGFKHSCFKHIVTKFRQNMARPKFTP